MRSIVLVSGGLDSAVALSLARREGDLYALSFDYGQRHRIELEAAKRVVAAHGPVASWKFSVLDHFIVELDGLVGGSSLTDNALEVPKAAPGTLAASVAIPSTYVPARNTVFIAHALHYAERLQCDRIVIGANAIDYSGYPDCRPDYINAWNALAKLATKNGDIKVVAPLINMSKEEIIRVGENLGVDFSITHSCYDPVPGGEARTASEWGREIWRACGECDSCRIRRDGFEDAEIADPTNYAPVEWASRWRDRGHV